MKRRALVSLAALAALLLSAGRASTEEDAGVRPRFGANLEGGAFIVPGVMTLGAVGGMIDVGAQLNNLVAIYLSAGGDVLVGELTGSNAVFSLVVELTFKDTISVGVGPTFHEVRATNPEIKAEGILGGGRLRLAFCPASCHVTKQFGLTGVTFGADVRLMFGTPNFVKHQEVFPPVTFPYKPTPMISPTLSIGYQFLI
jgi:hypothetical protein